MTLYRTLSQRTRFCFYVTATGAALCSLAGSAKAQQNQAPPTYPHPRAILHTEPGHLPQVHTPIRPVAEGTLPVQLLAGEAASPSYQNQQGNYSPQPEPRRGGLAERFGRLFRTPASTTPPVDPGMRYPRASESVAGPPPAPGASGSVIPSIPPTNGVSPQPQLTHQPQQPQLFEPGASVNAIGNNLIPPIPATESGQVQVVPVAGPSQAPLQNIPELKALMVGDSQLAEENLSVIPPPAAPEMNVPAPTEVAQTATASSGNINAPLPDAAPRIAPGEPSEPVATTAQAEEKDDPFANLFPGDKQQAATTQPETMASQSSEGPYTGLSLDVPEAEKSMELLPPPPREELPQLAGRAEIKPQADVAAPPKEIQTAEAEPTPEARPARLPKLDGPPPAPGVPEHELAAIKDVPKVASASSSNIEMKPATPPVTPPAAPPSTEGDQQSKLERIAARRNLMGLKGFCPVVLRDERDLVDSSAAFIVTYNGHDYPLSSADAREKFMADPAKYAPASGGCDVIHLALTGERQEGSLDHAVWYKGRLYLFSGVETMETFVAAPSSHATDD